MCYINGRLSPAPCRFQYYTFLKGCWKIHPHSNGVERGEKYDRKRKKGKGKLKVKRLTIQKRDKNKDKKGAGGVNISKS